MSSLELRVLGDLANPHAYNHLLDISGCDHQCLIAQLRTMVVIRRAEEIIGDGVATREVICPAHLGIGQEAVAVGVSEHLQSTDRVFGAHRSHSHFLALGGDPYKLFAEILGKEDGCSRGMGGSMHLYGPDVGLIGTVPIVAGTVPLAVGAALAARKDGRGAVAVAYFGDGAAEEGVVHESLNLASVWKLPILFVCENNLFSSHLHISLRQPSDRIARYAEVHGVSAATVDGNDVVAVSRAVATLLCDIRSGRGPGFLEAVTYRWRGHVGHREDEDVGVDRGEDLHLWKARDPIRRLEGALLSVGSISPEEIEELKQEVAREVAIAWQRAEKASYPNVSQLLNIVYSERCR